MIVPAFKPDGAGGYTFCPRCAAIWLLLAAAVGGGLWWYFKERKQL